MKETKKKVTGVYSSSENKKKDERLI